MKKYNVLSQVEWGTTLIESLQLVSQWGFKSTAT